jgi:hypothetical protein
VTDTACSCGSASTRAYVPEFRSHLPENPGAYGVAACAKPLP